MPDDISVLLAPRHCGLIVFECQEGVIGEHSYLPSLANAARAVGMVDHIASLLDAARAAKVRVFYCKVSMRPDGVGNPLNTPLQMRLRAERPDTPAGPDMGDVIPALAPLAQDVVVTREHGLTGFYESGLDAYLRNTGVRTIVLTGVSLNIGIVGTAIEAVNRGYSVVVPTDCVAGDPPEYAEQALRYSVRNVAMLSSGIAVETAWQGAS